MAEPLLKRTFSRLRGRDRSRRKTDPKPEDIPGKNNVPPSSSSSPPAEAEAPPSQPVQDSVRRGTQITVAKKQNWAKLPSLSWEPPTSEGPHSPAPRAQDWENSSGKAQVSRQAWSQKTLVEDGLESRHFERELGICRTSCQAYNAGLPELTRSVGACVSSSAVKVPGQGAYLQSLERSSRAWVLSSGKPHVAEVVPFSLPSRLTEWRRGVDGESNIWYNPIPEEEDLRGFGGGTERVDYGDPWKRRDTEASGENQRDVQARDCGLPAERRGSSGTQGSAGNPPSKEISVEMASAGRREIPDLAQPEAQVPVAVAGGVCTAQGPSDSPGSHKKGGGASSVMDKIKSPGTVRRLSMKMRKLPELRRKLSLRSSRSQRHGQGQGGAVGGAVGGAGGSSPPDARKEASSNVISRYHLDTSAPARPQRCSSRGRSSGKVGYLSDGDSPELLPKQGAPPSPQSTSPPPGEAGLDPGSFQPYQLSEQPRCAQRVSGLLTVHLLGADQLFRSAQPEVAREVFCAIQVDGVTRARTALLVCRGAALPLNHTFNLELERARLLKLVILAPQPSSPTASTPQAPAAPARNRVCCLGGVAIPPLFRGSRSQQLCVKLDPRGLLYVKLTLLEQWEPAPPRPSDLQPASVFGVELRHLVEKEGSALKVPLLIQKSVAEIEKRGLKVVGLYRLCGSAAVKKELRDAFERDSAAVTLNEEIYPDINVITGILKDYLRELPSPLITRTLYEVVLEAMSLRPPRGAPLRTHVDLQQPQSPVALLECLPEPEKATLTLLLDHLSLVASYSHSNRMTCQNLAVCFGPVLLAPSQESWRPGAPVGHSGTSTQRGGRGYSHGEDITSAVDFKKHIEVLHYLLQLWPIPVDRAVGEPPSKPPTSGLAPPLAARPASQDGPRQRGLRLPLRLELPQEVVVSRRGRGRLESPPCNRYAGDWSICGGDFLTSAEADYDEVAGSDSEEDEEEVRRRREQGAIKKASWAPSGGVYVDSFSLETEALDLDAPFTCRLSLKDFDTLISDLERELAKQINICL
ncbi:rho GTPase-activating protein SYDE1 isoform X2 [Brienomyrus brachyistius]|uniref:rho GTPase-activating protein SYDE1 isoform X2 n=1 Tax=Brienomyrus brachyistius TaxID=42636 RepID=UPI0020B2A06D|nr:rho GTPase-activating protein SYDE1 isoform X2 [Brienomyrus brachyistius]